MELSTGGEGAARAAVLEQRLSHLHTVGSRLVAARTGDDVTAVVLGEVAAAVGAAVGFYDGILGPGTGSFLVFAMVSLLGYDFLSASAKAKIVNVATNLGALLFLVPHGSVFWGLGLLLGAANMVGGYLGARQARRIRNTAPLRVGIVAVGLAMTLAFFLA